MDPRIVEQLGLGLVCIILGLLGWLPPYDRNIFGFTKGHLRTGLLYALLPKKANRAVPRIVGTILLSAGVFILIGTAVVGSLE